MRQEVRHSIRILRAAGWLVAILLCAALPGVSAQGNARAANPARSSDSRIYFEKTSSGNASPIRYVARSRSFDVYVSREEADVVLHGGLEQPREVARGKVIVVHAYANVLRMRFVNSDLPASVEPLATRRAASTDAVAYRGIYPGTDAVLSATKDGIAFQLKLSQGADVQNVVLELDGATSIDLDARGNAVVHAGREVVVLQKPAVQIQLAASGEASPGAYEIAGPNRLRFIVSRDVPTLSQTVSD